jgi:hypothetical protein
MKNEELLREYIRDSLRGEKPINEFFGVVKWLADKRDEKIYSTIRKARKVKSKIKGFLGLSDDSLAQKWIDKTSKEFDEEIDPELKNKIIKYVRDNKDFVLQKYKGDEKRAIRSLTIALTKKFKPLIQNYE